MLWGYFILPHPVYTASAQRSSGLVQRCISVRERNSGIYGFIVLCLLVVINFYSLSGFHYATTANRLFTFPRWLRHVTTCVIVS